MVRQSKRRHLLQYVPFDYGYGDMFYHNSMKEVQSLFPKFSKMDYWDYFRFIRNSKIVMKIDNITRETMKRQIMSFMESHKIKGENILTVGDMFTIWFYSVKEYMKENNSNIMDFDRLHYPCDSNDNTLETALRSIFKEI